MRYFQVGICWTIALICLASVTLRNKDHPLWVTTYFNNSDIVQPKGESFAKEYKTFRKPFTDQFWCNVSCQVDIPCEYKDEVNLRIIVMTYQRTKSLKNCLDHVMALDTMGDLVSVEIWIDRPKNGTIKQEIVEAAKSFQKEWTNAGKGRCCIHLREANAGITGQWTDTWRPKENTTEMGLILEDDVDVAPMAYRWLKAVHKKYGSRNDIAGYTLQMQGITFMWRRRRPMSGPKEDITFMYRLMGTWGYSPHPVSWRSYQEWSHKSRAKGIKPYVPNLVPTSWYKIFERKGTTESMWEMWHVYYTYINNLFTVYCNLQKHTGRKDVLLSWNRKEPGLHYHSRGIGITDNLMSNWDEQYEHFPNGTAQLAYDGRIERRV